MAEAFAILLQVDRSQIPLQFAKVFPGVPYKKNTYYKQERAWRYSEQDEREKAAALPRNKAGLWVEMFDLQQSSSQIIQKGPRCTLILSGIRKFLLPSMLRVVGHL